MKVCETHTELLPLRSTSAYVQIQWMQALDIVTGMLV